MARKLLVTIRWKYDNDMRQLYSYMMQHIEYDKMTLEMTVAEYSDFSDDLDWEDDTNEDFYSSHFRPLNDLTNTAKLEWIFSGKLNFKIKLITE